MGGGWWVVVVAVVVVVVVVNGRLAGWLAAYVTNEPTLNQGLV